MTLEALRDLLVQHGVPTANALAMARQLEKRARQLSEQRVQPYEQALAGLLALYQESWAAKTLSDVAETGTATPSKWEVTASRQIGSYRIFDLREDTIRSPRTGQEGTFYVLETHDWVNVVVETTDQKIILIEQFRFGSREISLEIPGGVLDAGEDPKEAAKRELLEETGYEAEEYILLGCVRPNPAFLNNHAYTVLARSARKVAELDLDPFEDITTRLVAPDQITNLIAAGNINHALVVVSLQWYFLYQAGKLKNV